MQNWNLTIFPSSTQQKVSIENLAHVTQKKLIKKLVTRKGNQVLGNEGLVSVVYPKTTVCNEKLALNVL